MCLGLLACQQKMADQPRYKPLAKSDFFDDQRASRSFVEGTVARGYLQTDAYFHTGKTNGKQLDRFQFTTRK